MREDICIVLNEREPLKKEMADELEKVLRSNDLSVERLDMSQALPKIICERNPKVLVLDYILGDIGTALDVLTEIKSSNQSQIPVVLWTDEPSVNVAVSAMKLGANDYIELSSSSSIERLELAIRECISLRQQDIPNLATSKPESPIAQTEASKKCLTSAESIAKYGHKITVLYGETGTGRNTLARYVHQKREKSGEFFELDLDTWSGAIEEVCGNTKKPSICPLLSYGATVFIDHAEFDTGELLNAIDKQYCSTWELDEDTLKPMLIVGSNSIDTAKAWGRLFQAPIIEIPPLRERVEDFPQLVQRFLKSAEQVGGKLDVSTKFVEQLIDMDWVGNIKQLRAVLIEAACAPKNRIQRESKKNSPKQTKDKSSRLEQTPLELIRNAKELWERYNSYEPTRPEPFLVRHALKESGGNIRLAALKLGTGIPQIRAVIESQ